MSMELTKKAYEEKYNIGYGVMCPEGHIIRFYERFLKYEKGMLKGKMLDFGCGNGVHSKYFLEKGYDVYGVDTSLMAINQARQLCEGFDANFELIQPGQSILDIYGEESFDVILANQSLYYCDNDTIKRYASEFSRILKPSGVCLITMMSEKNCYFGMREEIGTNGLSKVILKNRLNETTYINFTDGVEELKRRLLPLVDIHIGEYNPMGYLDCCTEDGSGHHYMFIGKK